MRSKVTFFLLLMLSFTIVHDSVINMVQPEPEKCVVHYTELNAPSQSCNSESMSEIHGMFHFVGLAVSSTRYFTQATMKQRLSYAISDYTFTYQETSDKPPKA